MSDALATKTSTAAITEWTDAALQTVEQALQGIAVDQVQPALLAQALSAFAWRPGCPTADDLIDPATPQLYRRIPLLPAHARGYSALLIVWPAGYATPVHDHDGLWGLELVLDGVLEVEAFSLEVKERTQLVSRGSTVLGLGDSATFSQADYAHRCRNFSAHRPALTLHVYGGELERFRAFATDHDGGWQATTIHPARAPVLA
jgi:predicted metal-dependent enzyme (double-stranded beta helix superfamily)